ncbi:MAG: patatin-like phospholipase family protein [Gammaproteobacteria bacterium]|nr:patatin-like phospholipase family protein [Rhodocyclaceae bacterium]MBU3908710.1 patatin-like phospholipase family protein [Gammaproteobacteria bacterium]MBU3988832.1 patatin-like phospholipase family protein [Gammaproteobacteria bacterium]MBU4004738.1 patatin-like phospholipase family protein [Gammaproteobacteria bacterium]MBU4021341.1 patatin-like phospholipase family protein [Gammaproteobacteria bacterium]
MNTLSSQVCGPARRLWQYSLTLLAVLLLVGCASQPLVYPDVDPPEIAVVEPVRVAGRPVIALALGGGAARGFAHIGVIKELAASGIHPDIVVGTSVGSFVGALYAGGYDAPALEKLASEMKEEELRDLIFPDRGFVKGERLQDFVNQKLGNRSIEDLPIRFAAVATDLGDGSMAVFTRGNTGMAVRASSSIPGVFQPVRINGREYIDGGLVSPVPVNVARALGADLVIAVDIANRPAENGQLATTAGIVGQSLDIMMNHLAHQELELSDIKISPDTRDLISTDFTTRLDAIDEGILAARGVTGRVLDWLSLRSFEQLERVVERLQAIEGTRWGPPIPAK